MSVYKSRNSPYYHYDFKIKRRRFHGSTRRKNRRDAERVEADRRRQAEAELQAEEAAGSAPTTINIAVGRYWIDVGQHAATAPQIWTMIARLVDWLGPAKPVTEITTADVAGLVARRRGEGVVIRRKARPAKKGPAKKGPGRKQQGRKATETRRPVANATVNRTVVEPLRRVLLRERDVYGQRIVMPEWSKVLLAEPVERVREASSEEEEALFGAIRDDYAPALAFALVTGCRLAEIVGLTWAKVKWREGVLEVTGKGARTRPIPITREIRALLWPLQGHHETAVFTYVARRADRKRGIARGQRVPITYHGLKTRWRRDRAKSNVADFHFHDTRHTAGTRVLRETGNLKLAQQLLGHASIGTTTKYAHAMIDDLRAGMEAVSQSRKGKIKWKKPA